MTTPVHVGTDATVAPNKTQNDQNVHVHLSLSAPVGAVWQALVSPEGTAAWLGEGAVLRDKGQSYHCADGTAGVVRSFHPLEQLRLSWHSGADVEPSLIEVDLTVAGAGTTLRLWHEGVPDSDRPAMQQRWQRQLEALARLVPQD